MTIQKPLKIALINALICIISVLHYGATFIMIIPRDKTSTTLAEDAISAATRLNSES